MADNNPKHSASSAGEPADDPNDPKVWVSSVHRTGLKARLLGISYVLWMLVLAFFGSVYLMLPCLVLLRLSPKLYRKVIDYLGVWWYNSTIFFHQFVFGTRFVHSGDSISPSDRQALHISNHRTRLDWMFLWNWFWFQRRLANEKIMLKWELRYLGPFGWAMQFLRFVFLKRSDREFDMATMHDHLRAWADQEYPIQLLIFPEGTDLDRGTITRSHRFAKKMGRPLLRHTLYPRHGAFQTALTDLNVDAVYDITMAYPDVLPQNEKTVAIGDLPHEIHLHVRRYPISEIPSTPEQQETWLNDIWKSKEQLLTNFYENGTDLTGAPRSSPSSHLKRPADLFNITLFCVGLQIAFILFMLTIHTICPLTWIPTIAGAAFLILFGPYRGGIDSLELRTLGRTTALDLLVNRKPTKTD